MTLAELRNILEETGLIVQYRQFSEGQAPELPYLIFYVEDSSLSFKADNTTYSKLQNISLELYTEEKDERLEEELERVLTIHEIDYISYEDYIEDESMYLIQYEITI